MKLLSLVFSLLVFSGSLVCGEAEPEVKLSASMQRAVKYHKDACAKAAETYRKAVEKSQASLRRKFEMEIKSLTRKGDLEGALALKGELKKLEKETAPTDILGNPIKQPVKVAKKGLTIISATWGLGEQTVDVSEKVRSYLVDGKMKFRTKWQDLVEKNFKTTGLKKFVMVYALNGKQDTVEVSGDYKIVYNGEKIEVTK